MNGDSYSSSRGMESDRHSMDQANIILNKALGSHLLEITMFDDLSPAI